MYSSNPNLMKKGSLRIRKALYETLDGYFPEIKFNVEQVQHQEGDRYTTTVYAIDASDNQWGVPTRLEKAVRDVLENLPAGWSVELKSSERTCGGLVAIYKFRMW